MLSKFLVNALLLLTVVRSTVSLDNGLAMTPPMGWMSWERFRCITDCQQRPNECIRWIFSEIHNLFSRKKRRLFFLFPPGSERLFREIADRMVEDEYSKVGYEYVIIDDCWLASERDENGLLQPDPERFPSGIRNLSDYVSSFFTISLFFLLSAIQLLHNTVFWRISCNALHDNSAENNK